MQIGQRTTHNTGRSLKALHKEYHCQQCHVAIILNSLTYTWARPTVCFESLLKMDVYRICFRYSKETQIARLFNWICFGTPYLRDTFEFFLWLVEMAAMFARERMSSGASTKSNCSVYCQQKLNSSNKRWTTQRSVPFCEPCAPSIQMQRLWGSIDRKTGLIIIGLIETVSKQSCDDLNKGSGLLRYHQLSLFDWL